MIPTLGFAVILISFEWINIAHGEPSIDINSHPHDASISPIELYYNNGEFGMTGYRPTVDNADGYPLYIFLTGTSMNWLAATAISYTQYMSEHHFVAVSLEYSNSAYPLTCRRFSSKASLIWDRNNPQSALSILCNTPSLNVNCDKGIVVSGFSQGAQLASMAAVYAGDAINGMYLIAGGDFLYLGDRPTIPYSCLEFESLNIASNRIRSMVGQDDGFFGHAIDGVRVEQNSITGSICNSPTTNCLNADGSGWYIVQTHETSSGIAPHSYSYSNGDFETALFDNNYENDPDMEREWSFVSCLNWLIDTVQL